MLIRTLSAAFVVFASISPALSQPAGNPAAGKKIFAKCTACHAVTAGTNRIGPTLYRVVGRKAGSVPGYAYSASMKKGAFHWTDANLNRYLAAPRKAMPGTKMMFVGLNAPQDRANVIAWLKMQK